MTIDISNQRTCGNCSFNDGACYASSPIRYKCIFDSVYYEGSHPCHFELAPVWHAKWVHMKDYDNLIDSTWICSSCKGKIYMDPDDSPNNHGFTYCPMCGARMNGGEQND